jgi:SAM-dependent methyltransferase
MPVMQISRQPDALCWFDTPAGRPLLQAERPVMEAAMIARPALQPWLWVGPMLSMPQDPATFPPRSLVLGRSGARFAGSLRCGLPLPLPNESVGNVILQHALDGSDDGLLEECERVLEPGGRLWLFTLNAWSPYRARWRRNGLVVRDVPAWQKSLRALGLQPCGREVDHLGPVWRPSADTTHSAVPDRLRAACLLEAEKRTAAIIPPAPVKRHWRPVGAAPA